MQHLLKIRGVFEKTNEHLSQLYGGSALGSKGEQGRKKLAEIITRENSFQHSGNSQ